MFKKLFDYIKTNELKVIYYNNKINIVNYNQIGTFDNKSIEIISKIKKIIIKGDNLTINRLYDNELLIDGKIETIEFINNGDIYD